MKPDLLRRLVWAACCALLMATVTEAEEIEVGQPAPDFVMTGIDGKEFKLSDVTSSGKHVALMFSRAHW